MRPLLMDKSKLLLLCIVTLVLSTASTGSKAQYTRPQHRRTAPRPHSSIRKSHVAVQQHLQSLLQKCPLPGFCIRDAGLPTKGDYLREPGDWSMKQQKQKVDEFIAGPGFKARVQQLQSLVDDRGILISAGKPHHVGTTTIMIHTLRHIHNCTLPVEIAYRGDSEVDPVTRATLSVAFPPLHWLDLEKQQYPQHHNKAVTFDRYEPKIYALYHTRFRKVLLLDADNLPLKDPTPLFISPHMTSSGAMMWNDLWSTDHSSTTFIGHDTVYPLIGINKQPYWVTLSAGNGYVSRVAESGELLLDRVRHADVLEYLWWITSYSRIVYKHILGDKDTFGYAFAAAGKLHEYTAVAVPPGAAFRLKQQQQQQGAGGDDQLWRFMGMLQYDHLGSPAFFHRTFEKWENVTTPPQHIDAITGPLPNWFIMSYLGNKTTGLTPEIPQHTLRPVQLTTCPSSSSSSSSTGPINTYINGHNAFTRANNVVANIKMGSCPVDLFLDYMRLRDWGLPITKQPGLIRACQRVAAAAAAAANSSEWVNGSSSSSNDNDLWPLLHEHAWIRACRSKRQQQQEDQSKDISDARIFADRRLHSSTTTATGSGSSNGGTSNHDLPRCDVIDWHTARYTLAEYAEAVPRNIAGNPEPVVDSKLPALLLLPRLPAAAAKAGPESQAAEATEGFGIDSGCRDVSKGTGFSYSNALDQMQMHAIPAAMQWVRENIETLPILQHRRKANL